MDDLNFRNGKRVFNKLFGDFFYDNGERAFSNLHGDVFYKSWKRAYSCLFDKAYYEDGTSMGTGNGVHYSAEGVSMDLGPNVDSFECDLGEELTVHIQVGHKPSFKRAQLYGANGGFLYEV